MVIVNLDKEIEALSLDAMQLDSPSEINLIDLLDDLLRLIVLMLSNVDVMGWGRGGMNASRLVSRRLMRVVESCATSWPAGSLLSRPIKVQTPSILF